MPSIRIDKGPTYDFIKLDILYDEMIKPYFEACLKKHDLKTELITEIKDNKLPSGLTKTSQVHVIIKSDSDKKYNHQPNICQTTLGVEYLEKISNKIDISPDTFRLPGYSNNSVS